MQQYVVKLMLIESETDQTPMFRILQHTFGVFWRKNSTWKRIVMADTTSASHICFTRLKTGSLSTETVCNASNEAYCETLAVEWHSTKMSGIPEV